MGFLDNDAKSAVPVDGDSAYQMLVASDYPGAWIALERADISSSVDVLYNKAICLRRAGRKEEALELSRLAFRRLTEGVPQRAFDSVCTVLVTKLTGPVPMNPSTPVRNPTYAGILARWLYCLCLKDSGSTEEADSIASQLETVGIKPFPEEE